MTKNRDEEQISGYLWLERSQGGREEEDSGYGRMAWGILVMEQFCMLTVAVATQIYTCDKTV